MGGEDAGGGGDVDDFAAFGKPRSQQPRGFDPGRGPSVPGNGGGSATLLGGGATPTALAPAAVAPVPTPTPTTTVSPRKAVGQTGAPRPLGAAATEEIGVANVDKLGAVPQGEVDPRGALEKVGDIVAENPLGSLATAALPGGTMALAGLAQSPKAATMLGFDVPVAGHRTPGAKDPAPGPSAEAFGGDGFTPKKRTGAAPTPTGAGAAPTPTAAATALTLEQRRERARLRTPTAATQGGQGRIATKILLGA